MIRIFLWCTFNFRKRFLGFFAGFLFCLQIVARSSLTFFRGFGQIFPSLLFWLFMFLCFFFHLSFFWLSFFFFCFFTCIMISIFLRLLIFLLYFFLRYFFFFCFFTYIMIRILLWCTINFT